jgi:hypothetical protein
LSTSGHGHASVRRRYVDPNGEAYDDRVKQWLVLAMLAAGCGSGGGSGAGELFVAATIDGVAWRVVGQGSELATATGEISLTILGYTPVAGSKQADTTKPELEIVFNGVVPAAGTYDVATSSSLTVLYMPDRSVIYGGDMGNVTITGITSTLVDGTFAFAAAAPGVSEPVAVTDGSFHVPIGPGQSGS